MIYAYLLLEEAQLDFEDSLDWYAERSLKAAENFVEAFEFALFLACSNPFQWRNKFKDFYEIPLKKYPFTLVYKIEKDKIIVTAVFHHKRQPRKKYR